MAAAMNAAPDFDVALSFAGEDRPYVDRVANLLLERGIRVFYDLFEEAELWGKDLYAHLSEVYQRRARFTVMFISAAYGDKLWTNHERRAAQARAFQEAQEYILPARFDDTEIPGVLPTIAYVSLRERTPEELAALITRKIVGAGGSVPTELVRRDYGIVSTFASPNPAALSVIVKDDEGIPIAGCTVTAQADNGTNVEGRTSADGSVVLEIATRRAFKLLVAHPSYPAALIDRVDPVDGVEVALPRTDNVGSVVIHSTGFIPGLSGRLNPILDSSGRLYVHAENIAVDGGKPQPVPFEINVPIELEDAAGIIVFATVKHIRASTALVQYSRARNPGLRGDGPQ
jgi:hypothetical protein